MNANRHTYSSSFKLARVLLIQRSRLLLVIGLLCLAAFLLHVPTSHAAAQLMLTPTRVVFSGTDRNSMVTVINSGDETGTYRISLVNKRMSVDGQFEDIKTVQEGELFADHLLRYSPRQVVLEPGKSQVVRLSLRKPPNLKPGEYRSHMVFNAIPKEAGTDIASASKSKNISIKLTPIVSISIPVIVRQGQTEASASIASANLENSNTPDKKPVLALEIQRKGNQSIYGDLTAEFVGKDGSSKVISQVNGVAVYTPNATRAIKLPVNIPEHTELKNGTIRITYRSPVQDGGKPLAKNEFPVP